MPELFIPDATARTQDLCNQDPETLAEFLKCNPHVSPSSSSLPGRFAYNTSFDSTPGSRLIAQEINSLPNHSREKLSACVADYGEDVVALARFYEQNLAHLDLPRVVQDANGVAGVGVAAMIGRSSAFKIALERYQKALVDLNSYTRVGRVASGRRSQLRQAVKAAHENLNRYYQQELHRVVPAQNLNKNRGSALSGSERGITLAERHRGRRIHVADMHEGQSVSRFANALRYTGRGLIAVDVGFRAERVRNSYQNDEDWRREMAVQTGGLSGAAGTGFGVARTAAALSRVALAATPMGWVFLVGSTVAIGAVAAYQVDGAGQSFFGNLWDRLF